MTVLIVETGTEGLRGLLSRWLIQPRTGVFVGRLSARVREKLWEMIIQSGKAKGALMIYAAQNEQRFAIRSWGDTGREPIDFDGLALIRRPTESLDARKRYARRGRNKEE